MKYFLLQTEYIYKTITTPAYSIQTHARFHKKDLLQSQKLSCQMAPPGKLLTFTTTHLEFWDEEGGKMPNNEMKHKFTSLAIHNSKMMINMVTKKRHCAMQ